MLAWLRWLLLRRGCRVLLVARTATVLARLPGRSVRVRVDYADREEVWWHGHLKFVLALVLAVLTGCATDRGVAAALHDLQAAELRAAHERREKFLTPAEIAEFRAELDQGLALVPAASRLGPGRAAARVQLSALVYDLHGRIAGRAGWAVEDAVCVLRARIIALDPATDLVSCVDRKRR